MTQAEELELSIWTTMYWEYSPEDACRHIASQGWRFIDLSAEHLGELMNANDPDRYRGFRALLDALRIEAQQAHGPMQPDLALGDDKDRRRYVEFCGRWIEAAGRAGVKHLVLHPAHAADLPRRDLVHRNVAAFQAMIPFCARHGVKIAIENDCNDRFFSTADEIAEVLDTIGHPLVVHCFDTSHANWQGLDIPAAIRQIGRRLAVTHLSDNDGTFDQHLLPYQGNIDWRAVLGALREAGYEGTLNWELARENHSPADVRDLKLRHLERVVHWAVCEGPVHPKFPQRDDAVLDFCKIAWTQTYLG